MCIGGHLYGRRCCRPHPTRPIRIPEPEEPAKPVPLTGVVVNAKIVDFVAEVSIHQRYENVEDVPIEATYVFPLAPGASVSNFYAIVDGKKIEGKIKEKEQAKDQYDDAIAAGHSAYLLEEVAEKKNVFKTSIGNLPPKDEVVITIVYVIELAFTEDKKLEFVIPTNTQAYPDGKVVPRFLQPTRPAPKQSDHIVPPFGLKVDVTFDMTSKIKSISSPSHPIEFNSGDSPNSATVTLANQDDVGVPLVKNFEMRVSLANPDTPVFRVQDGVGMLALYPNLIDDDEDPITEMIFVVDRSGSMSGAKIQRVKDTLHIFLRSLPLGTLFNIVGFGSNYVSLFANGSKEYEEKTLQEATKHVNELKANLGGTSLLPPLKHIFSQPLKPGIPRQIFVLTDGEVDNTQECIDFVREKSTIGRVFAFGIHGASPELVNGIAKAGEGKAEIISGNENIEGKVMVQLKRALQPALTDLKINWGRLHAEQTPFKLPPVFSGSRLIAYAYLSPDAEPDTVVFSAQTYKGPYTFEHPVTADDLKPITGGLNFIPKLAARSMIRDLEEGRSSYHTNFPGFSQAESKKKAIELSIKSGMLSKYTAFIAVNESNKAIESTMQTRDVNKLAERSASKQATSGPAAPKNMMFFSRKSAVAAPRARGAVLSRADSSSGSDDEDDYDGASSSRSAVPGKGAQKDKLKMEEKKRSKSKKDGGGGGRGGAVVGSRNAAMPMLTKSAPAAPTMKPMSQSVSSFKSVAPVEEAAMQAPSAAQSGLRDIVLQQKAAGNFSEDALKLAGGSLDKLRTNVTDQLKAIEAALLDQILITAFICGVLRTKYKDESDQWSLVDKKAIAWIKREVKKVNEALASFDWGAFAVKLAQ